VRALRAAAERRPPRRLSAPPLCPCQDDSGSEESEGYPGPRRDFGEPSARETMKDERLWPGQFRCSSLRGCGFGFRGSDPAPAAPALSLPPGLAQA
jgi:hypothetical protein